MLQGHVVTTALTPSRNQNKLIFLVLSIYCCQTTIRQNDFREIQENASYSKMDILEYPKYNFAEIEKLILENLCVKTQIILAGNES